MKLQAYCLRDTKAEVFAAPFFVPREAIALRAVGQMAQNPHTDVAQYPQDFLLYRVGEYDTDTALLTPCTVELVCAVSAVLQKPALAVVETKSPEVL